MGIAPNLPRIKENLDRNLKLVVYGQDQAIGALSNAIKMARSGLGNEMKPIGAFLFAGPTGVGKTEVTRQLAKALGIELLRFDMSEYMERHTVSRLIGAPPGYVGFDQGGLLTDGVDQHPHCVLLLDEKRLNNGLRTDGRGRPGWLAWLNWQGLLQALVDWVGV